MTRKEELRREAKAARERVVATVGELGGAIGAVRDEASQTARKYAPFAASAIVGLVLLRIRGRRR